ncbi:MAG: urease accessory protein UreE [Pseudomonadota bacterium]
MSDLTDSALCIFTEVGVNAPPAGAQPRAVALPFAARQKARQRITLPCGTPVGLKLPRGTLLRGGTLLTNAAGDWLRIDAAPEPCSLVCNADSQALARTAYHLGNRHVPVQVGADWLRYGHDRVLDEMVRGLGQTVQREQAPFEPEGGAYGGGHAHAH